MICSPSAEEAEWIMFKCEPNAKLRLVTKCLRIDGEAEFITDWFLNIAEQKKLRN